jgi:hypothetical protein
MSYKTRFYFTKALEIILGGLVKGWRSQLMKSFGMLCVSPEWMMSFGICPNGSTRSLASAEQGFLGESDSGSH